MGESINELKSLLVRMKEVSEKAGLKFSIQKLRSWCQFHHVMTNRREKSGSSDRFSSLGLQKSLQMVTAAMKLKDACSLENNL